MISAQLTQVVQDLIKSAGLVDSGRLVNSIKVEYQVLPNGKIQFELTALYYLQYYIDEVRLIEKLTNHPGFGDLITSLMPAQMEAQIAAYLNTPGAGGDINWAPQVGMSINYLNV